MHPRNLDYNPESPQKDKTNKPSKSIPGGCVLLIALVLAIILAAFLSITDEQREIMRHLDRQEQP